MNITKDMVKQALMINEQSEVRSNVDRERPFSHAQVLQTFINAQTRGLVLRLAYLPKDRQLDIIDLLPVTIHNSTSQPAYRNRLGYISVSSRQRVINNEDGTVTLANSNPTMVELIRSTKMAMEEGGKESNNPFNSVFVTGHFRLTPVPADINNPECIKAFNAASDKLIKAHHILVNHCQSKGIDVDSDATYRSKIEPLYVEYQQLMSKLLFAGYAALTQAIVAEESKLIPALTLNSGMNHSSAYLNTQFVTKKCSFIPVLNEFFGSVSINSSAEHDDLNPQLTTGLRQLNSRNKQEGDTSDRGKRQECSRLAYVHDRLGNPTSVIVRRLDTGYHNTTSNTKSMAESFESNTANNQNLMIRGSLTPMAIEEGVNASVNGLTRAAIMIDEYRTQANTSLSANSSMISDTDITEVGLENIDQVNQLVEQVGTVEFNFDTLFDDGINSDPTTPTVNQENNHSADMQGVI